MTKTELMETYTTEQLAGMVINLQSASEIKNDEIHKLKWQISSLEEENGRLQAKLDTYNNYLLPRCTKEAKEMIDRNYFSGVRIVTLEQWNNSGRADGKVCFPKEYEQTVRGFLNIDTSEIQDDCHRFGIESLQRYLKNPAPIKIPKRDSENIDLSKIQKCQEEYEKVLKESPLEGVMNKITKDILEQKNNAMAMEFTRIICDLLKRYGVHVHCTETKLSEKITNNAIEEQYGIVFDSMDFSQHDKEFTDKIEELQSEVEKYRKAFEDARKERDCQIAEYRKMIEELENHHKFSMMQIDDVLVEFLGVTHEVMDKPRDFEKVLQKLVDNDKQELERAKNTINQIDDILERLFGVRRDTVDKMDEFEKILKQKAENYNTIADYLCDEPISVAQTLISAKRSYELSAEEKQRSGLEKGYYHIFDVSELRQIAEHLLIYCNHHKEEEK